MTEHANRRWRSPARTLPADVKHLSWAADQLGIGLSTAYRLASAGELPGAFKVGAQWRISVPRFLALVHGGSTTGPGVFSEALSP